MRFLQLLSTQSWRERALVVDPNAEVAAADREAAVAAHSKVGVEQAAGLPPLHNTPHHMAANFACSLCYACFLDNFVMEWARSFCRDCLDLHGGSC